MLFVCASLLTRRIRIKNGVCSGTSWLLIVLTSTKDACAPSQLWHLRYALTQGVPSEISRIMTPRSSLVFHQQVLNQYHPARLFPTLSSFLNQRTKVLTRLFVDPTAHRTCLNRNMWTLSMKQPCRKRPRGAHTCLPSPCRHYNETSSNAAWLISSALCSHTLLICQVS